MQTAKDIFTLFVFTVIGLPLVIFSVAISRAMNWVIRE